MSCAEKIEPLLKKSEWNYCCKLLKGDVLGTCLLQIKLAKDFDVIEEMKKESFGYLLKYGQLDDEKQKSRGDLI